MRIGLALAALIALSGTFARAQDSPAKIAPVVNFCELVSNPGEFDGKVISVRARVSHEFEDFTLFDTNCARRPDVWIYLGGSWHCTDKWEAMEFSCEPGSNLRFRSVEYPVVKDENLEVFLKLSSARKDRKPIYRVTATLTGTFFGENPKQDKKLRETMPGYGHMGCCFQIIVSQVSNVTTSTKVQDRNREWNARGVRSPEKLRH